MPDFDQEYSSEGTMLYGREPSVYLDLFVRTEHIPRGPALDIGCGDGRNTLFLASCGFAVTGTDTSRHAIEHLRHEADAQGLRVEAVVGDARTYHYPPNYYTLVVANTVVDHVEKEEGNRLIRLIQQTTAPGGYIFVSVFTTDDPGNTHSSFQSTTAPYVKRYFYPGELRELFKNIRLLRYHEELCLDSKHGPPHYHAMARLMAQKS